MKRHKKEDLLIALSPDRDRIDLKDLAPEVRTRVERALARESRTVSASTRVSRATKKRWEAVAARGGKTLCEWMRESLEKVAGK